MVSRARQTKEELVMHPEIRRFLLEDRIDTLRRDGRRPVRATHPALVEDLSRVELRLCRISDDPALEQLAQLEGREVPVGRLVIAEVEGRLVAALPLRGGPVLADPFARTAHLRRLLELRATQLREPGERRGFIAGLRALRV
jgi:hypothetical protein